MRLPDECVAFEVVGGPYMTVPKGSIVELSCIDRRLITCFFADRRMLEWAFTADELRPLTPSAVEALALVQP